MSKRAREERFTHSNNEKARWARRKRTIEYYRAKREQDDISDLIGADAL